MSLFVKQWLQSPNSPVNIFNWNGKKELYINAHSRLFMYAHGYYAAAFDCTHKEL